MCMDLHNMTKKKISGIEQFFSSYKNNLIDAADMNQIGLIKHISHDSVDASHPFEKSPRQSVSS